MGALPPDPRPGRCPGPTKGRRPLEPRWGAPPQTRINAAPHLSPTVMPAHAAFLKAGFSCVGLGVAY